MKNKINNITSPIISFCNASTRSGNAGITVLTVCESTKEDSLESLSTQSEANILLNCGKDMVCQGASRIISSLNPKSLLAPINTIYNFIMGVIRKNYNIIQELPNLSRQGLKK